jgi:hypothetical protein
LKIDNTATFLGLLNVETISGIFNVIRLKNKSPAAIENAVVDKRAMR